MSDVTEASNPAQATDHPAPARYRCVCGASFEIRPDQECDCPDCGRRYSPRVLSDTLTFAGDFSPTLRRPSTDEPDALIGTNKGHYRIVARLGAGGMGCVYQAIDESLQRYVALKVIRRRTSTQELTEQLVQEARAQARVNHPNVVHIYYVGQSDDAPFFAMELIPGRTLADRLADGPLPFATVVRIGIQVASALERAVQFDIVHGDIKPSNILEVDPHTVKISDFGLSRQLSNVEDAAGRLLGTPNYLSPESIRGEKVDARSDIYSLGVTLYELSFGKLPYAYETESLQERLDAHISRPPTFPEPWPESMPEAWREVLTRMLAKSPEERYPSYASLIADLTKLLPRRLIPAPRPSRGIAWLIDTLTFGVAQFLCVLPAFVLNEFDMEWSTPWKWPANIIGSMLSGMLLLLVVSMQTTWGATPGKMLFDLCIVDRHGLRPTRKRLAIRALFQLPWSVYFCPPLLQAMGLDFTDGILITVATLLVLVNIGLVLVRTDQRAVHDRLLGTQVVVNTET